MAKPKPDPEILDEVPWSDQVTDYDDKHFTTLRSRQRRTAIRALRPAAIAWGGRPCWPGCLPPTSAAARPVAVACGSWPP